MLARSSGPPDFGRDNIEIMRKEVSAETRKKMSEARRGKGTGPRPASWRNNQRQAQIRRYRRVEQEKLRQWIDLCSRRRTERAFLDYHSAWFRQLEIA